MDVPRGAVTSTPEQFIAHTVLSLPVGWQAIEIYPRLDENYWKSEYAAGWAKLNLLGALAQHNALDSALHHLDGRLHATAMPNFWRNSKHYYPDQKSPATNSLNRIRS